MKAVICKSLGNPSTLSIADLPLPSPGAQEAKIAIRAAGINFPDILMVAGKYQHKPKLPFVPGFEIAGEILEIGSTRTDLQVGDRVMAHMTTGGYAEQCLAPIANIRRLPENFDFSQDFAKLLRI